jgi:hypothetical protein
MNEYLEIVLWFVAIGHIVIASYYDLFKDDDAKTTKHEVGAILMLALIVVGSVI